MIKRKAGLTLTEVPIVTSRWLAGSGESRSSDRNAAWRISSCEQSKHTQMLPFVIRLQDKTVHLVDRRPEPNLV